MKGRRKFIIDGSMARGGGGFTYLVNIVPELSRLAPNDEFRVLVSDERLAENIDAISNVEVDYLGPLGLTERARFTYMQAAGIARDWNADLYFSASDWLPPTTHCPSVVALRNANVFKLGVGQNLTWKQKLRCYVLNAISRLSAKAADKVMFVSKDSSNWIGDMIALPHGKRAVIHHGIDPKPWRDEQKTDRIHERPYILSVSSIYPYKNYVRLIEAYVELLKANPEAPDLVIIGDDQDAGASQAMREAHAAAGEYGEWIHILGEVPYADIRAYYRNASLFVFPSYLETFGHPLLEAMAADVPLVAADIPVFREIAGDAAIYADPFDTEALTHAMENALFAENVKETLVKRGRERLKKFTWTRSASALLAMFESVLDENRRSESSVVLSFPGQRDNRPSVRSGIAARVAEGSRP